MRQTARIWNFNVSVVSSDNYRGQLTMKFNPPCYSVTFELLESLTDSSVEEASLSACGVCLSDCVSVRVFLNFYSCDNQFESKEWRHFSQGEVILAILYFIKGAVYGQGLN